MLFGNGYCKPVGIGLVLKASEACQVADLLLLPSVTESIFDQRCTSLEYWDLVCEKNIMKHFIVAIGFSKKYSQT